MAVGLHRGDALFRSCDETAGVDRLMSNGKGKMGHHIHSNLCDCIDLPDGSDGEMDIERLDVDGDWLRVCGSHSLTRGNAEDGDDPVDALSELAAIDRDPNCTFLGRIPLRDTPDGPQPVGEDGERAASAVKLFENRSILKH